MKYARDVHGGNEEKTAGDATPCNLELRSGISIESEISHRKYIDKMSQL